MPIRTWSIRARVLYFFGWLAFLAVVFLLDWSNARAHHVIAGLLALPGVAVALLWVLRGGRWVFGASAMTAAILLAYVAWWIVETMRLQSIDPSDSVWSDMWLQVWVQLHIPGVYLARSKYLDAAVTLYWYTLMPLVQVTYIPFLLRSLRGGVDAA